MRAKDWDRKNTHTTLEHQNVKTDEAGLDQHRCWNMSLEDARHDALNTRAEHGPHG